MWLKGKNEVPQFLSNLLLAAACCIFSACGLLDGSGPTDGIVPDPAIEPGRAATASLAISGSPQAMTAAGNQYLFIPQAQTSGGNITFTIDNKPAWAVFDSATGQLSGTPDSVDIGTYSAIVIRASNGRTNVALSPFSIDVLAGGSESILLSWTPPTTRASGDPLTDLAGYRFYYGQQEGGLDYMIDVNNPGLSMYEIGNLTPGEWYFVAAVYDRSGAESPFSNQAIVSIL